MDDQAVDREHTETLIREGQAIEELSKELNGRIKRVRRINELYTERLVNRRAK